MMALDLSGHILQLETEGSVRSEQTIGWGTPVGPVAIRRCSEVPWRKRRAGSRTFGSAASPLLKVSRHVDNQTYGACRLVAVDNHTPTGSEREECVVCSRLALAVVDR
jgi:hypothetical protein